MLGTLVILPVLRPNPRIVSKKKTSLMKVMFWSAIILVLEVAIFLT
jgi:hypothetical protein